MHNEWKTQLIQVQFQPAFPHLDRAAASLHIYHGLRRAVASGQAVWGYWGRQDTAAPPHWARNEVCKKRKIDGHMYYAASTKPAQ